MKGTAMAKDFDDLLAKMSSDRRAEIERLVEKIHSSPQYRIRLALQIARRKIAEVLRGSA
jgi:hypothetical protein